MKQKRNYIIKLNLIISLSALFGCGISSNTGSMGSGGGEGNAYSASQSSSPGEMTRLQNQNIAGASDQNSGNLKVGETEKEQVDPLYEGLSSHNPVVRKNSEQTLRNLVEYNPQYLEELKTMEIENKNPDSWFSASQIIKEAEKARARALDEEIKRQIVESQAADAAARDLD